MNGERAEEPPVAAVQLGTVDVEGGSVARQELISGTTPPTPAVGGDVMR